VDDRLNRLRVVAAGKESLFVELPEIPLRGPYRPPDFRGVAAPEVPPSFDPYPTFDEIIAESQGKPPAVSRISLGVVQAVELTSAPAEDSGGLVHFIGRTGDSRYFLVHLACSFAPAPGERFVRAALGVRLSREDQAAEPAPIAWSIEPRCLPYVTELARTQKVDASVKLASVSVGAEQKSTRTRCLIRAFNELQPDPRWEFQRARGADIVGTQRLIMVVQTPSRAVGKVSLSAQLRRSFLPLWRRPTPRAVERRFGLGR